MTCIRAIQRTSSLQSLVRPKLNHLVALKKYNSEEEKVLILISSLMVWNKTPAKMQEVGGAPAAEGGAEGGEPPAEAAPEEGKEGEASQVPKAEDG